MRFRPFFAVLAALVLTAEGASAAACRSPHRLPSRNYSLGVNARFPSRAIFNPCSNMYDFGRHPRRLSRHAYPGAMIGR